MKDLRKIILKINDINFENSHYRTNFLKKLYYFIENIAELVLKIKNIKSIEESSVYYYLLHSLKKKGANYLRQDSLYVLSRELKNGLFNHNIDFLGKLI